MSQRLAAADARRKGEEPNETVIDDGESVQELLDALEDGDCRCILDAAGDEALTASEISETCDLPLSTAYRKIEMLAEASLLVERVRIRRSGKHASEYVRAVDDIVISADASEGMQLRLRAQSRPKRRVPAGTGEW